MWKMKKQQTIVQYLELFLQKLANNSWQMVFSNAIFHQNMFFKSNYSKDNTFTHASILEFGFYCFPLFKRDIWSWVVLGKSFFSKANY